MLEWDGSPAMFAPEGDGCLQRAKREDAGRFSKEGKSLDDFWYFSSLKSTIREKVSSYFFESDHRMRNPHAKTGLRAKPHFFINQSFLSRNLCMAFATGVPTSTDAAISPRQFHTEMARI